MPEKKTMPLIIDHTKHLSDLPNKPSLLQTMKEGFGLGIGSSLGHRLVDSILGQRPVPISNKLKEFEKCMKEYDNEKLCEKLNN